MTKNTTALPATGQDIFNYLAKYTASDHQIRMIVELEKSINHAGLITAMRHLATLVPILNYRLAESDGTAGFLPSDPFSDEAICPLFTEFTEDGFNAAMDEYTMQEIDPAQGPFFQVGVFRRGQSDTLCCKIEHSGSDAGGLKACVYLLAQIYSCLVAGDALPSTADRSNRAASGFLQAMGVADPAAEWAKVGQPTQPSWRLPSLGHQNLAPAYQVRHIINPLYQGIKTKCAAHKVTVNEALLTAYYRALLKLATTNNSQGAEIRVTVDLRRFIPEGANIFAANASGGFMANIVACKDEAFNETLAKVLRATRAKPVAEASVPIAALFELVGQMDFSQVKEMFMGLRQQALSSNHATPNLSNAGQLPPLYFGSVPANSAYYVGPAMYTPEVMLMASGYKETISLAISFFQSDIDDDFVSILLDRIVYEFSEWTESD